MTVSIAPQQYFVERIAGDRVRTQAIIQPGVDPHTFELKPEQLRSMANSKLYLAIGVTLEKSWLPRLQAAYPNMKVVDTSRGVDLLYLTEDEHGGHGSHGKDETATQGGAPDPHIWLSPRRVKVQAENIYQALAAIDPSYEATYRANRDRFLKDLDALDGELKAKLAGIQPNAFMTFHPEWGYFANDYGLKQMAIEVEGSEPSASEMARVMTEAKENNVRTIVVQPELSDRSAAAIASEIGATLSPISAFSTDWADNLRKMTDIMLKNSKKTSFHSSPSAIALDLHLLIVEPTTGRCA